MHFQFLIEDSSSGILIDILMKKLMAGRDDVTYDCKSFRGIGGFTKKNTVKETKTGKLLNDLATYLRGFDKRLHGIPAAIVVVLDNDTRDTREFLAELEEIAEKKEISVDHVFCIAVEEVEAWLLGDTKAVLAAYPKARQSVLKEYVQDSICGTWEVLADAVCPGGLVKFRKKYQTYIEIGGKKCEWAEKIGNYMDINENQSPSFQCFVSEIQRRLPIAS